MRNGIFVLALGGALLGGGAGQAATIFFENFADEAATFGTTLNFTNFDQFGVSGGTVDLITGGNGFGITCATVGCVDLDGSTGNAGFLSAPISFLGGVEYTIEAWLSGNQRNAATETVEFGISAAIFRNVVLGPDTPIFTAYTLTFTLPSDTVAGLFFQDLRKKNVVENVPISRVLRQKTQIPP